MLSILYVQKTIEWHLVGFSSLRTDCPNYRIKQKFKFSLYPLIQVRQCAQNVGHTTHTRAYGALGDARKDPVYPQIFHINA